MGISVVTTFRSFSVNYGGMQRLSLVCFDVISYWSYRGRTGGRVCGDGDEKIDETEVRK